jgi:hypothetical protein
MQRANGGLNGSAITQAYVTKKIDNTTLKLGRQELPMSLSPLAFSEDWNVFKNTFDAAVAINTDIQDTTLVGAWVSGGNRNGDLSSMIDTSGDISNGGQSNTVATRGSLTGGAYMVTAANKSIKEAPMTLSYYALKDIAGGESGSAIWGDVQVDAGLPVKIGLQGGQIMPENSLVDTKAFGAKVSGKVENINLSCAYSSVNNGDVALNNVGTNVKTPLYTQMILNQDFIKKDSDTWNVQASMPVGAGTVSTTYSMSDVSDRDYSELDLIYKTKAMGTDLFAAYVIQDDPDNSNVALKGKNNLVRLWTRYNF